MANAQHIPWPGFTRPGLAASLRRSLLIAATLLAGIAAAAERPFDELPDAKALAVSPEHPQTVRGLVYAQPHQLAASALARQRCQAAAAEGEACELVRLDDQRVTTGAEIRERVGDDPHPLFLWRYRRGAVELFLAGSVHILKPTLYPLPAQFQAAFDAASTLALEVDISAVNADEIRHKTLAHAMLPADQKLADVLPPPLYRRLERDLADFGMTPAMVDRAKPAMVMNQIVVSRLLTLGYLPDSGLENHFLRRRTHQRIVELESIDDQLELLFDQPMPTQIQLLAETLDVQDDIEPMLADMLTAWLAGDDDEFLRQFKAQSGDSPLSRAFTRQLLDERNHGMAERVRAMLNTPAATPTTYFVLVGAAHLVGDEGVVNLLARSGVEGERIMSNQPIDAVGETMP